MDAGTEHDPAPDPQPRERARRRTRLLTERAEAKELLERVAPRRAAARRRAILRALTFRR